MGFILRITNMGKISIFKNKTGCNTKLWQFYEEVYIYVGLSFERKLYSKKIN
jgi:hypothetical protein